MDKNVENIEEKRKIGGIMPATLIEDGDTIALDAGTDDDGACQMPFATANC